ncbi:MAG TPA: hypothetical protein VFY93_16595 [Planctomycetota bacterium]|nr:hypothetical protein [Planctomycetota bacterium]
MRVAVVGHDSLCAVRATPALLLALAASCATPRGPEPEVSAASAPGGVRVRFRRLGGADPDRPPELRADGGDLSEIVVSPDLRAVSAFWKGPAGKLACRFPYDGAAARDASAPADATTVAYVFLDALGVRVTADLPRGCLLLPALPLRLHVPDELEPARLVLADGRALPRDGDAVLLPLTTDERGILHRGDIPVTVETANGPIEFLVGIDDDGTPAAISGYVASAPEGPP